MTSLFEAEVRSWTEKPIPSSSAGPGRVTLEGVGWRRTVEWRDHSCLGSAAFWLEETRRQPMPRSLRVGRTLAEEVALCLLGGYGVNEAMSTSAFRAVRDAGLLDVSSPPSAREVEAVLRAPMNVDGYARPVRYRFPVQRAQRVASAVAALANPPVDGQVPPRDLRAFLTTLSGVGLKTASWVVRNLTASDDIAIIDIHIRRAGVAAGVFDPDWALPRDYLRFEDAFCAWAGVGGVPTAALDLCIWSTLARMGTNARLLFGVDRLADMDQ
jgi:thermostable 8-oxoguanine DNA glycosylase